MTKTEMTRSQVFSYSIVAGLLLAVLLHVAIFMTVKLRGVPAGNTTLAWLPILAFLPQLATVIGTIMLGFVRDHVKAAKLITLLPSVFIAVVYLFGIQPQDGIPRTPSVGLLWLGTVLICAAPGLILRSKLSHTNKTSS